MQALALERRQELLVDRNGDRTFCLLDAPHVRSELVDRLDILFKLVTVKHDPSPGLQRSDAVLEDHGPDRDARVHRVGREIKVADRARVGAAALAL